MPSRAGCTPAWPVRVRRRPPESLRGHATEQASVTYRIVDPGLAASRLDFSIDPETGRWRSTPLEQVAGLLTELAQQPALELLAATTLPDALAGGVGDILSGSRSPSRRTTDCASSASPFSASGW